MTHAALPGGWRAAVLMDAVAGIRPVDLALHLVGIRDNSSLATKARQDLGDAVDAYRNGDEPTAMATATDLAEEIREARQPGRGAAA
jgi:uncharacterized protein YbgA (DUF1722 family)